MKKNELCAGLELKFFLSNFSTYSTLDLTQAAIKTNIGPYSSSICKTIAEITNCLCNEHLNIHQADIKDQVTYVFLVFCIFHKFDSKKEIFIDIKTGKIISLH